MSDNKILRVSGESLERLKTVIGLTSAKAVGYTVDDEKGIIFYRYPRDAMTPFPSELSADRCAEIAYDWLTTKAKYGKKPDHDGDNEPGWLCYCDGWGWVDGFDGSFVAVKPMWMMYGK